MVSLLMFIGYIWLYMAIYGYIDSTLREMGWHYLVTTIYSKYFLQFDHQVCLTCVTHWFLVQQR